MTVPNARKRRLGTMVAYGFGTSLLESDIRIAKALGVDCLEIFPDWRTLPDPSLIRAVAADSGLQIHSAHGCWGGQTIKAARVDLGSLDASTGSESLDDIKRCIDWLDLAGGSCLVIHPGGFSDPEEREHRTLVLVDHLLALSEHASGSRVRLCVENMPPGVHPGSAMVDIARVVTAINDPNLGLALDTGHAHLSRTVDDETRDAGTQLFTTHVHDNHGAKYAHLAPGEGTIDWPSWARTLDEIGYEGPIMLECIRHFRAFPEAIHERLREVLERLTGTARMGG